METRLRSTWRVLVDADDEIGLQAQVTSIVREGRGSFVAHHSGVVGRRFEFRALVEARSESLSTMKQRLTSVLPDAQVRLEPIRFRRPATIVIWAWDRAGILSESDELLPGFGASIEYAVSFALPAIPPIVERHTLAGTAIYAVVLYVDVRSNFTLARIRHYFEKHAEAMGWEGADVYDGIRCVTSFA